MAEFLTTVEISSSLERIIRTAKGKVILVSPFLKLSRILCERLKDASEKKITIKILYGKEDLEKKEKDFLMSLKNIELYYFQNLHAKCYFNENLMIISSMNMYEFSQQNNREMGILLSAQQDTKAFQEAANEVGSILKNSIKQASGISKKYTSKQATSSGYCIRCKTKLSHNPAKPYCGNCYNSWSEWENPFFEEKYCHTCGKPEQSTIEKPECYQCYISGF